jgi:hypothetical protein
MEFCITVESTPYQRYREDGGQWRSGLEAILSEHTARWDDIGGGSGGEIAENDYEVLVDNILGEYRLFMVLDRAGYKVRRWNTQQS